MDIQRSARPDATADGTGADRGAVDAEHSIADGDSGEDPHRQPPSAQQAVYPPVGQLALPRVSIPFHQGLPGRADTEAHFAVGHGQVPPLHPPDPIAGFVGQAMPYRRTDWLILTLVLILSILVMVGFCLAGFALYNRA